MGAATIGLDQRAGHLPSSVKNTRVIRWKLIRGVTEIAGNEGSAETGHFARLSTRPIVARAPHRVVVRMRASIREHRTNTSPGRRCTLILPSVAKKRRDRGHADGQK